MLLNIHDIIRIDSESCVFYAPSSFSLRLNKIYADVFLWLRRNAPKTK